MPEIDGLRFIAVALVAFVMHLGTLLVSAQLQEPSMGQKWYQVLFWEAGYGVQLFFMISGFILALPFAKHIFFGEKEPKLKAYYWRRITRLEPLYIITMVLYFLMRVLILKTGTFEGLLPNFFASIFYVHNVVFQESSAINGVAWTLEIEVQFYLLAPLFCQIYKLQNLWWRRGILLAAIVACTIVFSKHQFQPPNYLLDKINFFLTGMFLVDVYLHRKREENSFWLALLAITAFVLFLFVPTILHVSNGLHLTKLLVVAIFFYLGLTNKYLKKLLSVKIVTVIGGMCYSIYLLHMGIFGLFRHNLFNMKLVHPLGLNIFLIYLAAIAVVLLVSALFFVTVEKPTMRKDWYKFRGQKRLG